MDRIGEYLIRRLVGEGGMGKVYEAEERLSRRRVALKVLRGELARAETARRLFLNEMTILAHLDHPNVVRSLACAEVDGQLVMALEFLEGRTLRDVLLERGSLPWPEAVGIARQIASALAAAHRQSPPIVHRDLKPENVMLLADGSVKVMDFGIAKVLEALSKTTTHSVGTLQYMSPEQIDAAGVDGRSDLYCFGLVLYELIAGRPPFESASPRELLNLQCTAAPPPLPEAVRRSLPRGLERLLFELLEKAPENRPQTAEDVLHELEPFAPAMAETVSAGAASAPPSSARKKEPADDEVAFHDTLPSSTDAVRSARSKRRATAADTIALVERASAPRHVSRRLAAGIVLGAAIVSGLVTYGVRRATAPTAPATDAATAQWADDAEP
jgi:serine/threonine-protein kinase